ncbi:MAG: DUF2971 domain-containing protein [Candidatus Aminicenantes bacterium]|nr:DUF2971 domain-containing protein [Candidatus Aminicenantes bacterium]
MKLPPVIYKYESFDTYSLSNLKNAQIFFNRPVDFNDPFDSSLVAQSFENKPEDIVTFYNQWVSNKLPNLPEKIPDSVKTVDSIDDVPRDFINMVEKGTNEFAEEKQKEYLNNIGCSCFSEVKDNLLMWSHYSNGHKGFCLEFDTSFEPFNKALKVEYSDFFPKINPIKFIIHKDALARDVLLPLLTKYSCWDYEKEWRIFHREPRKLFTYKVEALKAVYFGASMIYSHLEIICLILQGQNPNVDFYNAKRSSDKFEVEFEKFTYTPYVKIKK